MELHVSEAARSHILVAIAPSSCFLMHAHPASCRGVWCCGVWCSMGMCSHRVHCTAMRQH